MKKLKQYVIIQKKERDIFFKSFPIPYLGHKSENEYCVSITGRGHRYLSPERIKIEYEKTHTIIYFDHISDIGLNGYQSKDHSNPYKEVDEEA